MRAERAKVAGRADDALVSRLAPRAARSPQASWTGGLAARRSLCAMSRRLTVPFLGACFGPRLASPACPRRCVFRRGARREWRSCRWRRARARSNDGHGDGPQAGHAARTDNGRRVGVPVVEYGSLTCPHCATFSREIFPELKKDYIDTGKVRFIFREFSRNSLDVAAFLLARCVGDDKAFAAVELLFSQQDNGRSSTSRSSR